MRSQIILFCVIVVSQNLFSLVTHAEGVSSEEIIQQLTPSPKKRGLKDNRGISVDVEPPSEPAPKVEPNPTIETNLDSEAAPSINLYINFEYNSAELRQDSLIVLNQLAAALKDQRLSGFDFLIGGHTDTAGSDEFNMRLSEQRARTVKKYLVNRYNIDSHRLIERGFGESRLLDPANPLDGINRRVQIITLTVPEQ